MEVWGLSQAEAARLFGVSRQALGKWLQHGIPAERAQAVSDLAAATDLLVHYLKRDRIPAVVRRPIHALEDASLLDLAGAGRHPDVARDVPRNVPIRAHVRLTVELLREPVPDAHVWWRIADPAWTDPLDPTFAQRQGGRWNPPDSFPTLYLNEGAVTARMNLRAFIAKWPYESEDLRDDTGPILVGCTSAPSPSRMRRALSGRPSRGRAARIPIRLKRTARLYLTLGVSRWAPRHVRRACVAFAPDRRVLPTARAGSWRGSLPPLAAWPGGCARWRSWRGIGDSGRKRRRDRSRRVPRLIGGRIGAQIGTPVSVFRPKMEFAGRFPQSSNRNCFLLDPRGTGKFTWLRDRLPVPL